MGKLRKMQYKDGKNAQKNVRKNSDNSEFFRFTSENREIIPVASAADTSKSPINMTPYFLILKSWLVVNSSFSLSKVRCELYFTSKIAPIVKIQNIIPPSGCGTINPNVNPIKNIRANIRFQKLSLFILALMKPTLGFLGLSKIPPYSLVTGLVFLVISKWLKSLGNDVKSSISIYRNCWFKTYNLIIPKLASSFKGIVMAIMALSLCFPWNGAYATEAELSSINELTEYIKLVEKDNSIPRGLLLAIAKTESNINPYAINVNGKAVFANSMQEAVFVAKGALARGITNVGVGVMQVNYRWHKERFRSVEKMLDPKINIQYAGNLLSSLFKQHGTWHKAIRYYHSANYEHHRKYSKKVVMAWIGGRN